MFTLSLLQNVTFVIVVHCANETFRLSSKQNIFYENYVLAKYGNHAGMKKQSLNVQMPTTLLYLPLTVQRCTVHASKFPLTCFKFNLLFTLHVS